MRNLYKVLGTTSEADDSQLKSAFRNLAKTFHPDLNAGDKRAEERFKEVNQAYEVLRDPRARAAYDAYLADKRSGARQRFRKAAATMSATFVLSAAFSFPLMIWLQGGRFSLARDQETARLSENVTIAPRPRFVSGTDGASGQETGEGRMASASPAVPNGVVRTAGDQASPGGMAQIGLAKSVNETPPEWDKATVASSVRDAIAPPRMQPNDAKRLNGAPLDLAAKQPRSDKARRTGPEKILLAERADGGAVNSMPKVSASPPPAAVSQAVQRWPTADEPFVSLGAINR